MHDLPVHASQQHRLSAPTWMDCNIDRPKGNSAGVPSVQKQPCCRSRPHWRLVAGYFALFVFSYWIIGRWALVVFPFGPMLCRKYYPRGDEMDWVWWKASAKDFYIAFELWFYWIIDGSADMVEECSGHDWTIDRGWIEDLSQVVETSATTLSWYFRMVECICLVSIHSFLYRHTHFRAFRCADSSETFTLWVTFQKHVHQSGSMI